MADITLGGLRDLWKNVSDWVTGASSDAPKVKLTGSNVPFRLAAGGIETVPVQRTGMIAAGTSEVVLDMLGGEKHLEALAIGTSYKNMSVYIYPYDRNGGYDKSLRVAASNGSVYTPGPFNLHYYSGGENDFFRLAVYDEETDDYVVTMKRQARFGNGLRMRVNNQDEANPHTLSVNCAIYSQATAEEDA